jgi:hypothetical protein
MANKTRKYVVHFTFKAEGNRAVAMQHLTTGTTVQRAISKVVKDLNEGKADQAVFDRIPSELGDEELRASDLMVLDVRSTDFTANPYAPPTK